MQFWSPRGTYPQGQTPYDLFKDRVSAINSIVGAIKGKIANNYWEQLNKVTISELGKKLSKDQEIKKLNIYGSEPPNNIYPQNLKEVSGQFVDYSLGKMLGTQQAIGRLQQTQEVQIPKMDKQQLLNYVMSGGEMDFSKILKVMKERPSFLGEYSELERSAINSVMGKDAMGELETGVKRAGDILDYFKEPEKKTAKTMLELAQTDWDKFVDIKKLEEELDITTAQKNMGMYCDMFNKDELTDDQFLKVIGAYVAPAKLSAFKEKLELLKETRMWDTMSEDNKLKFFGAYVVPKGVDELKDLTGGDINTYNKLFYGDEENWGVTTPKEYAEAKDMWERTNKNLPAPTLLKIMEKNLRECLDDDYTIISRDDENKLTDYWFSQYEIFYPYYEEALEGKMPKYLPPDKIHKVGAFEGAVTPGGVYKGQYGSALVEEKETGKETEKTPKEAKGKEDEFGYIIGATYKNADGKLLKYLGNDEWEEISPSVEGKQRGIK